MAIKQEVNAPLILTTGIVSALLLLVAVFGVQAWFFGAEQAELEDKWKKAPYVQVQDLKAQQDAQIHSAGFNRTDNKQRTITINQAMQVIVQTGGKLPTTQPQNTPNKTSTTGK
jgi:hypothetical protein